MSIRKKRYIAYACALACGVAYIGCNSVNYFFPWPIPFLLAAAQLGVLWIIIEGRQKPAPFQLVLRLADDKGGNSEDDKTFGQLHQVFTEHFHSKATVRFKGFDTDGSFIWFYFLGSGKEEVFRAIEPHLKERFLRPGSYFISDAHGNCASAHEGVLFLGEPERKCSH